MGNMGLPGCRSNCTEISGLGSLRGTYQLWILVAVIAAVFILSLCWNVLCCISQYSADGGKKFLPRFRRSFSLKLKDMEDNPIYGNINYTQSRVDPQLNSSDMNNSQTLKGLAQGRAGRQDCYANLQLKAPKPSSGRSSPQIQYSDVVTLPRVTGAVEMVPETDTASLHSDLYASVESERNKALGVNKDYANRL
ncbi:signaling threshold-regulating transmembrane adapter 1-like [Lepisosteus oculatus]|uniref:signaling threshold-regulating transmembrane adapter 1-like n=1 Tax=Lepisosteus oculatus TaxID=7918 RepID=UPI0035F509F8